NQQFGSVIAWNYFGPIDALGQSKNIIAAAKAHPIAHSARACCYERIILTGYSLGGIDVVEVMNKIKELEPTLKVDAVLTVDPVDIALPGAMVTHTVNAAFGNYCSWTNLYQNQGKFPP